MSRIVIIALIFVIFILYLRLFLSIKTRKKLQSINDEFKITSTAFHSLNLPAFYKDKHGKFLGANKAFDREFGENKKSAIEELSHLHITCTEEMNLLFDNNIEKTVKVYFSNFLDENKNILGSTGVLVDISEEKREKKKLIAQKNRLNNALDFSELGYWEYDVKSDKAYYSKRWKELMGYTYEDDEPQSLSSWINLVYSLDMSKTNESIKNFLDGKSSMIDIEHRVKTTEEELWVNIKAKATKGANAEIVKLIGTIEDITKQKQEIAALSEQKKIFKTFIDSVPIAAFIKNKEGQYSYLNNFYQKSLGFLGWKNKTAHDLYPKNIADSIKESDREAFYENISEHDEIISTQNGISKLYHTFKFPLELSKETLLCGIAIDITKELTCKNKLALISKILDDTKASILITDSNKCIIQVNRVFEKVTGYLDSEIVGKNISIRNSSKHSVEFYNNIWSEVSKKGHWSGKVFTKNKDNSESLEIVNIHSITDKRGKIKNYYVIAQGIQREKIIQKSLDQSLDTLTGLPNKTAFVQLLDIAIAKSKRNQENFALIYINIDDFKAINLSKGEHNGDVALKEVAKKLSYLIRQNDALVKLNGDEFAIILEETNSFTDINIICNRILEEMKKPIILEGIKEVLSVSMGASIYPEHTSDAKKLVDFAHNAMYKAKREGKNTYTIYQN